jgi:putative PIN family toxin of toxin-antitoxin system
MRATAVLDTSVVVSGIGWRNEARTVLRLLARRTFVCIRTPYLTQEWLATLEVVSTDPKWQNANWANWLEWLKAKSRLVEEPPAKLIVRRDLKDNPILAAAISQNASFLVSQDRDILDLQKPYGVRCLSPRTFIAAVLGRA